MVSESSCKTVILKENRETADLFGSQLIFYLVNGIYRMKIPHDCIAEGNTEISDGSRIEICKGTYKTVLFFTAFQDGYDEFHKYTCDQNKLVIGSSIEDDIYLRDKNVGAHAVIIDLEEQQIQINCMNCCTSLNGIILKDKTHLKSGDMIECINMKIIFHKDFLMINSCMNIVHTCLGVYGNPVSKPISFQKYITRIITVSLPEIKPFSAEIQPPEMIYPNEKTPLIYTIGPMLTMSFGTLSVGLFNTYRNYMNGRPPADSLPMLLLPAVMIISSLFWYPMQRHAEKKQMRNKINRRNDEYEIYIEEVLAEADKYYGDLLSACNDCFLSTDQISSLLARSVFPQIRILPQDSFVFYLGNILTVPDTELTERFTLRRFDRDLHDILDSFHEKINRERIIPFLYSAKQYKRIIVFDDAAESFLLSLLYQNLFFGDKKRRIVYFTDETWFTKHQYILNDPNCFITPDIRSIAFTGEDAAQIEMDLRINEYETMYFVTNEDLIEHVPEEGFCFFYGVREEAAEGADLLIDIASKHVTVYSARKEYRLQDIYLSDMKTKLSAMFLHQLDSFSQRASEELTFFDLLEINSIRELPVYENWNKYRAKDHLYAVLGRDKNQKEIVLDLHDGYHGPHGLIAGMTGSGKSELLITMILSIAVRYSPREVQFLLIDFKGGGILQMLSGPEGLPHIANTLDNLEARMIDKATSSLELEIKRRERLLNNMSKIVRKPVMDLHVYQSCWKKETGLPYLSDMIIIVDEFAELKQEVPDFLEQLLSISRVGRSLGFHLILSTQKPAGIVNDQIWANSRFKICLKVAERQDSIEVIHHPDAAYIEKSGQFCLLRDNSLFFGQSAYTSAKAEKPAKNVRILEPSGRITGSYVDAEEGETQAEQIIDLLNTMPSENPYPIWMETLETKPYRNMAVKNKMIIGQMDDYARHLQPMIDLSDKNLFTTGIFTMDPEERMNAFYTVLSAVLDGRKITDPVYILDDLYLKGTSPALKNVFHFFTDESDQIHQMLKKLRNMGSDHTWLIVTDAAHLLESDPMRKDELFRVLDQAPVSHIHTVIFATGGDSMPYRLMSRIQMKIALNYERISDLQTIFSGSAKMPQKKRNHLLLQYGGIYEGVIFETTYQEFFRKIYGGNYEKQR